MAGFSPVGSTPVAGLGGNSGNFYPLPGGIVFHGSNVTSNQVFLAPRRLIFMGATPSAVTAPPRVTWFGAEVLHEGAAPARVSWTGVEVLRTITAIQTDWIVTWMGVEVAHDGVAAERVSWVGAEVCHGGRAFNRVSWIGVEVLRSISRRVESGWVSLLPA